MTLEELIFWYCLNLLAYKFGKTDDIFQRSILGHCITQIGPLFENIKDSKDVSTIMFKVFAMFEFFLMIINEFRFTFFKENLSKFDCVIVSTCLTVLW